MIKEVAFVAIAVSDKERARKFYQETLELKPGMTAMEGGWVEYDSARPRSASAAARREPSRDGTSVAFEVDDIDSTIATLKERGVVFDMEKTETPVCWMAQFRDPDGNKLLVHKRKGRNDESGNQEDRNESGKQEGGMHSRPGPGFFSFLLS